MTDQVYMEVIVGEDEAPAIQEAQLEDSPSNKTFVPVAWAAAYGLSFLLLNVKHLIVASMQLSHTHRFTVMQGWRIWLTPGAQMVPGIVASAPNLFLFPASGDGSLPSNTKDTQRVKTFAHSISLDQWKISGTVILAGLGQYSVIARWWWRSASNWVSYALPSVWLQELSSLRSKNGKMHWTALLEHKREIS